MIVFEKIHGLKWMFQKYWDQNGQKLKAWTPKQDFNYIYKKDWFLKEKKKKKKTGFQCLGAYMALQFLSSLVHDQSLYFILLVSSQTEKPK